MGKRLIRALYKGEIRWGLIEGESASLMAETPTTLAEVLASKGVLAKGGTMVPRSELKLLSPVTRDGDFICQATNYRSHVKEIGRDPNAVKYNVFFHKASSCICAPDHDIQRPSHVQLLDYEVELAFVVGRAIDGPINATEDTLSDWIAGIVITNDVTARDVQISHEQFHKSKSYRSFGPTGPWLWLTDGDELQRWKSLRLMLKVNGETRQNDLASDMIFDPVTTLNELSRIRDMKPGDMIATGTPSGVALKVPSPMIMAIARNLSPARRFALFLKGQLKIANYLQNGDLIETSIRTDDGRIDLGLQTNKVVAA